MFHLDFLSLILGLSSMARLVERGGGTLITETSTKEIFRMVNSTAVVPILGQMVRFTSVSGLMVSKTAVVHLLGQMELFTSVSGLIVKSTAVVPILGQMVRFISVSGLMVCESGEGK